MTAQHVTDQRAVALVVLAAGGGTRMRSAVPKVLHTIGGCTLLAHVLRAATGVSPDRLVVVVASTPSELVEEVRAAAAGATTVIQDRAGGTGHATQLALDALGDFEGTVVVLFGDTPLVTPELIADLVVEHAAADASATVLSAVLDDPTGYGRVVRDSVGQVQRVVEQRDASTDEASIKEVNSGIMALDARSLRSVIGRLDDDNEQGELLLTDVIGLLRADGRSVHAVATTDRWQTEGCNDRAQLARLGAELNRRVVDAWMTAGVTVVDPASTWIDVDVELAADVTIKPGVQLLGRTRIASGASIGPDSTLVDVYVDEAAEVVRAHASQALIGPRVTVGPFAYLRPGTVIGADGKVGAFVETKNSTLGQAAKVPHLSYVGDADIGDGTNIGAGTIFANYDGERKHRTVIGRHCRTGSDNVFVAPVVVGDGASTGAGTVVRRDVPPGALALSAGSQRHVDGWVERKWPDSGSAEAARAAARVTAEEAPDADMPAAERQNEPS